MLPRHTWLPGHALPHIPQLLTFDVRFTHALADEQNVSPVVGQRHTPAAHSCVALHRRPQAPQFATSVWRFTQLSEQLV